MIKNILRQDKEKIIWTIVAALVLAGILWFLGLDLIWCLIILLVIIAIGGCLEMPMDQLPGWVPPTYRSGDRGARREVNRLAWTMDSRDDRVSSRAVFRVRTLASVRLARLGIDLAAPDDQQAAEAALGRFAYHVLVTSAGRSPTFTAYLRCVDAVEKLDLPANPDHPANPFRRSES